MSTQRHYWFNLAVHVHDGGKMNVYLRAYLNAPTKADPVASQKIYDSEVVIEAPLEPPQVTELMFLNNALQASIRRVLYDIHAAQRRAQAVKESDASAGE